MFARVSGHIRTKMTCKIAVLLALCCVAQVLGSPLLQDSAIAAPHAENRGLIEDILAAERAILDLIASCNALTNQVVTSTSTIVSTVTSSVTSIIAQLRDLGLSDEEIAEIQRLADTCVSNIENIALELLTDITRIIDLLTDILGHLTNPIQLALDIVKLENSIDKLTTGEIVDNILSDIAAVERTVMTEYRATLAALDAFLSAGAATIVALQKIVS